MYVDVDYTFYNPGDEKEILMGFEAMMPGGDVSVEKITRKHPFMYDFTVDFNGKAVAYKSDIVNIEAFQEQSQLNSITDSALNSYNDSYDFFNSGEYVYVNYFKVRFQKGENKIHHTYAFDVSSDVMTSLNFVYILSAAGRWAGGKIGDFTLNLNMEKYSEFLIGQSFFKGLDNWNKNSNLKIVEGNNSYMTDAQGALLVRSKEEGLKYHKKDFAPSGELFIWRPQNEIWEEEYLRGEVAFNYQEHKLNYNSSLIHQYVQSAFDKTSLKVLRKYPKAKRGVRFRNKTIQSYFKSLDWYDEDRKSRVRNKDLDKEEKDWLEVIKIKN